MPGEKGSREWDETVVGGSAVRGTLLLQIQVTQPIAGAVAGHAGVRISRIEQDCPGRVGWEGGEVEMKPAIGKGMQCCRNVTGCAGDRAGARGEPHHP